MNEQVPTSETVNPYGAPETVGLAQQTGPRMTWVAYKRGIKNAALTLPVVGLCALGFWFVGNRFGLASQFTFVASFILLFALCFVAMLITFARGRRRRGEALLECGYHPARILFLINAVVFFCGAIAGSKFGIWGIVFCLAFSAYWLFMAAGRLSIHERGIWLYHAFMPWSKLTQYHWSGNTLTFQTKGLMAPGRGAVPVPAEQVDDFERLLSEYTQVGSPPG